MRLDSFLSNPTWKRSVDMLCIFIKNMKSNSGLLSFLFLNKISLKANYRLMLVDFTYMLHLYCPWQLYYYSLYSWAPPFFLCKDLQTHVKSLRGFSCVIKFESTCCQTKSFWFTWQTFTSSVRWEIFLRIWRCVKFVIRLQMIWPLKISSIV